MKSASRLRRLDPEAQITVVERGLHLSYGALVLATGSRPLIPALPGRELAGVYALKNPDDAANIARHVESGARAVIVGGGLIGLEMAEALAGRGMDMTLLEMQEQVLFGILDSDLAEHVHQLLRKEGIKLQLEEPLQSIRGANGQVQRSQPPKAATRQSWRFSPWEPDRILSWRN